MAKTKQVFISYDSEDTQFAHRLADDLQRLGVQVWIAPESIRPGEGWVRAIERGLAESSHVVVVLTPAALGSRWVEKETDVAIARERKGRIQVIPLDVKPCEVPLLLSSYQMVSFRRDYAVGLSQLAGRLGVRITPTESVRPPRRVSPRVAAPKAARPTTITRELFEEGRIYYTKTHEWVRIQGNEAACGISDHAQAELSDIVYVELPEVGNHFAQGDPFGAVESVLAASDVYAPLSGTVVAVNQKLYDSPERVNDDPYGKGWLIKIRPDDLSELRNLKESA